MRRCLFLCFFGLLIGCGGDDSTTNFDIPGPTDPKQGATEVDDDNTGDTVEARAPIAAQNNAPSPTNDVTPDMLPTEPAVDSPDSPDGGCGQAAPSTSSNWTLRHDGMDREFLVHLPENYDPNRRTPVVVNYHGRSMTARQHVMFTGMNDTADDEGFIVVYPEGTGSLEQTFNGGLCCGSAQSQKIDDVGFTAAMLDELESRLCVDPQRIYATGMSNGGFMAHRVACELSDRFAAISAVAGVLGMFDCQPEREISVLHMHGTADSVVSYNGYAGFVGVPSTMDTWADVNGCRDQSSVYFQEDDVVCEEWTGCDSGAEVRLCTIEGGGHTWPGGSSFIGAFLGRTTDTISANDASWEFFKAHTRQ